MAAPTERSLSGSRSDAVTDQDRAFMRRALALAPRGWGRVHPNPLVGAVLVRDGRIVGEGWHGEYGGPHAEVAAIAAAGAAARGATLYVTLEPCSHEGKTPPCTRAIVNAGIARVVFAAADPDPDARGGAAVLTRAGIPTLGGVEADAARADDAGFFHVRERSACWVALKLALSLDARLAEGAGQSTAVTSDAARADVHRLRAGFDAIMVGAGTVRTDDPVLTVRGAIRPRVPPARVVIDGDAALATGARLVRSVADAPVVLVTATDAAADRVAALEDAGVRVLRVPRAPAGIDVAAALTALYEAGLRTVLCEGGGRLAAALLAQDLVHRMQLYWAPRFFGPGGVPAFPFDTAPRTQWRTRAVRTIGDDLVAILDRTEA